MTVKNALVIVESPTKAKTIRKFLPKNFSVEASVGHIRDLPQSAADIPKAIKDQEWTKLGVNIEQDFEPLYIIPKGKSKVISDLRAKLKGADALYLATDEDREGESISWHLTEVLKPKVPVKRMVFHEITGTAIKKALEDCRDIDTKLVRAQETRRILDRLVGYTVSPLIWKKIAYGLSAGRVQSAALRLIVDRERERAVFKKARYWDLEAELAADGKTLKAKLTHVAGRRIATSKDFDETTGALASGKDVLVLDEKAAQELKAKLKSEKFKVKDLEERPFSQKPAPPFITSTLQQEANRKLGMSSREAMRTAQGLYEEGLITYMRTDSPSLSQEALKAARDCVKSLYGSEYLPDQPRRYSSKDSAAQEAHEAIRPAGTEFVHPDQTGLSGKPRDLYELIWMRTVASQMVDAEKKSLTAKIESKDSLFSASGTTILFPGFLRAYVEGSDDPEYALSQRESALPPLKIGLELTQKTIEAEEHETQPPGRFTEASLVRDLEKAGIGRPSTYASIITTLIDREYVRRNANALVPTFTGFAVTQLLEKHFAQLVDSKFTSEMEASLDEIAEGKKEYLPYLKHFFLGKMGLIEQIAQKDKKIDAKESRTLDLPHLPQIDVKIGRYGAYVVKPAKGDKEEIHASIPEDIAPADLTSEKVEEILALSEAGPKSIGSDPVSGKAIYCLSGRFGPYVQLGEVTDQEQKPRRASIPKGYDPRNIPISDALRWLSLPRNLGIHPETKADVLANNGRFGPYVQAGTDFRSLKKDDDVYTVTLARALEILAQPKSARATAKILKELGNHPESGKPLQVLDGKYGPYVKHKTISVSIPKETPIESVTLQVVLALLDSKKPAKKTRGKSFSAKRSAT